MKSCLNESPYKGWGTASNSIQSVHNFETTAPRNLVFQNFIQFGDLVHMAHNEKFTPVLF